MIPQFRIIFNKVRTPFEVRARLTEPKASFLPLVVDLRVSSNETGRRLELEQLENVDQAEVGLDGASARRGRANVHIEQRGLVGHRLASKPGTTAAGLSVVGGPGGCPWARPRWSAGWCSPGKGECSQ